MSRPEDGSYRLFPPCSFRTCEISKYGYPSQFQNPQNLSDHRIDRVGNLRPAAGLTDRRALGRHVVKVRKQLEPGLHPSVLRQVGPVVLVHVPRREAVLELAGTQVLQDGLAGNDLDRVGSAIDPVSVALQIPAEGDRFAYRSRISSRR